MLKEINHTPEKKRVLKKVRLNFISKRADEEAPLVDPATTYLCDNSGHILHSASGLIEINRKICLGPQHLNPFYKFVDSTTEDPLSRRIVTLDLEPIRDSAPLPWEYTFKRLESYGDLELATWAHRMANYYANYPKVMGEYEESVNRGDPKVLESLRKAKDKAVEVCKKIETEYSYFKVVHSLTKESHQLQSFSYSEGLLKEMGYSQESFLAMIKNNGFPAVFDTNCVVYLHIVKNLLECGNLISEDVLNIGEEYETLIYNSEGSKHKVTVQLIHVFEPNRRGFTLYSYFVLKNNDTCKTRKVEGTIFETKLKTSDKGQKSIKEGLDQDTSDSDIETNAKEPTYEDLNSRLTILLLLPGAAPDTITRHTSCD